MKVIQIIKKKSIEEIKEFGVSKGHTLSFWLSYINYNLTPQDRLRSKNHINGLFKLIKSKNIKIERKSVPLNCDKYNRLQIIYDFGIKWR